MLYAKRAVMLSIENLRFTTLVMDTTGALYTEHVKSSYMQKKTTNAKSKFFE
jgi:hypothetical protein